MGIVGMLEWPRVPTFAQTGVNSMEDKLKFHLDYLDTLVANQKTHLGKWHKEFLKNGETDFDGVSPENLERLKEYEEKSEDWFIRLRIAKMALRTAIVLIDNLNAGESRARTLSLAYTNAQQAMHWLNDTSWGIYIDDEHPEEASITEVEVIDEQEQAFDLA